MRCRLASVGILSTTSNASLHASNSVWRSSVIAMENSAILSCRTIAGAAIEAKGAFLTRLNMAGLAVVEHNVVLSRQTVAEAVVNVIVIFVI